MSRHWIVLFSAFFFQWFVLSPLLTVAFQIELVLLTVLVLVMRTTPQRLVVPVFFVGLAQDLLFDRVFGFHALLYLSIVVVFALLKKRFQASSLLVFGLSTTVFISLYHAILVLLSWNSSGIFLTGNAFFVEMLFPAVGAHLILGGLLYSMYPDQSKMLRDEYAS